MVTVLATGLLLLGACTRDDDESRADDAAGGSGSGSDDGGAQGATAGSEAESEAQPAVSAGCGTSTLTAGEERVTLQSGGVERWYLRHLPPAYDGEQPLPLVVDFHGYSEGADAHRMNSELGPFGDEHDFVTLTPQGRGDIPFWDTSVDGPDIAFIGDLLDEAESTLCIDLARVYATGLSNGAMMTSMVACAFADRIAAAAPVAGVAEVPGCTAARAVPVVSFHGTDDPFLDYEGGFGPAVAQLPTPDGEGTLGEVTGEEAEELAENPGADSPSVPDVMAGWAGRNGCDDGAPDETTAADDVTILTYPCPTGAEVELYRIEGGGHTWPGSPFLDGLELVGKTTFSISANEVMWAFFEDHPLDA